MADLSVIFTSHNKPRFAKEAIQSLLDQTHRRLEELDAITRVSSALRAASTRAEMAPIILAQLREILHADGALFCTLEAASQEIVIELAQGNLESLTGFRIPANEGLTAQVIQSRQIYTTLNLQDEPNVFSPNRLKNARTAAIAPLVSQDYALGALWVTRTEKKKAPSHPRSINANSASCLQFAI